MSSLLAKCRGRLARKRGHPQVFPPPSCDSAKPLLREAPLQLLTSRSPSICPVWKHPRADTLHEGVPTGRSNKAQNLLISWASLGPVPTPTICHGPAHLLESPLGRLFVPLVSIPVSTLRESSSTPSSCKTEKGSKRGCIVPKDEMNWVWGGCTSLKGFVLCLRPHT